MDDERDIRTICEEIMNVALTCKRETALSVLTTCTVTGYISLKIGKK